MENLPVSYILLLSKPVHGKQPILVVAPSVHKGNTIQFQLPREKANTNSICRLMESRSPRVGAGHDKNI